MNTAHRLATGGGPPIEDFLIDPNVADISPNLMKTAPVLFTSNLSPEEITERQYVVTNVLVEEKSEEIDTLLGENVETEEVFKKAIPSQDNAANVIISDANKENDSNKECVKSRKKLKRRIYSTISNIEQELRIQRIQKLIGVDAEIAQIRKEHEKRIIKMKEEHLQKIQKLELEEYEAKKEITKLQLVVLRTKY